ncbi:hypothetical protein V1511DRAFT_495518 [Dipodascopsis uninucleata]
MSDLRRKVAIITGTNGGLGQAIARRLMDSLPPSYPLTIIVTARRMDKAVEVMDKLKEYGNIRADFVVDYVHLDLASSASVVEACETLKSKHSKIDYLFLNAGGGDFVGIDFVKATFDIMAHPVNAVTFPTYQVERSDRRTADNLGYTFQINVFSNYLMIQLLEPALKGGRVILVSSCQALAASPFDADDIQMMKIKNQYNTSKMQLDLIHLTIVEQYYKEKGISVFLTDPGICITSLFAAHLNSFTSFGMYLLFLFARLMGSYYHVIDAYKGANSMVWAAIDAKDDINLLTDIKYTSASDRWGREYLRRDPYIREGDKENGEILVAQMDKLIADLKIKIPKSGN